jgi:hypothetical protein
VEVGVIGFITPGGEDGGGAFRVIFARSIVV